MNLVLVASMGLAACGSTPEPKTSAQTVEPKATRLVEKHDEEVSVVETQVVETEATALPPEEPQVYRLGIFGDVTTTNYWAFLDTEATVWNGYVLYGTHPTLYDLAYPKILYAPSLATELPKPAVPEEDFWTTRVQIQEGLKWSDGEGITVNDLVFAAETTREFGLAGSWLSFFDASHVDHFEVVDDYTLKIYFSQQPGVSVWQLGVGLAPFMPEHYWAEFVAECRATEDPITCLYGVDGIEEPSAGPFILSAWEPGVSVETIANATYFLKDSIWTFYADGSFREINPRLGRRFCILGDCSGDVEIEYLHGPFVSSVVYNIYRTQEAAVLALTNGEVDLLLNPLGLEPAFRDRVEGDPDLIAFQNPTNVVRYLAFNLRKSPNNYKEFRQAVAYLVDKEYLTADLLRNRAFPAYGLVPAENAYWANLDTPTLGRGMTRDERVEKAKELLKSAGFSWDTEPEWDDESGIVVPGSRLKDPNGNELETIVLLTPPADYDPLRTTAATWIERWCNEIGIPVEAEAISFEAIMSQVFEPEAATGEMQFDWYILGWGLGDPALPSYLESFFACANDSQVGGLNTTGYCDEDFEAMASAFLSAQTLEGARDHVFSMDAKIGEDLPYITLFTVPILELSARARVTFPFTETLDGLQHLSGMPDLVMPKQE